MTTAVAWALIHSMWQATLIALVLMSVRLASRSAQIRYLAGVAALSCILGCFAATLFFLLPEQKLVTSPIVGSMFSAVSLGSATPFSSREAPDRFSAFMPYIAWFWFAGVCSSHVWQLAGMVSVWRLRRRGTWPAADVWVLRLTNLRERLRVSRPVTLVESLIVNAPVVIGHLRPVILIPAGLITKLPADQVEAVLLHELAHVRRCDYLINLFQRWTEALFFYHPAVWWVSHVVRTERESCCDDIAASASGNAYCYAQALAALEQNRLPQSHPALAASAGPLAHRIRRILQGSGRAGVRGVLSSLTLLAATAVLAIAGWQQRQTPKVAPAPLEVPQLSTQVNSRILDAPSQATVTQLAGPWRKWIDEDVVYIITEAERTAYNRLDSNEEREIFIEEFWRRRGRMPDGASFKEEHYRRVAYANARFAEPIQGWKTDRGRIYISLGPPAEIESHPKSQSSSPAYEIWRYRPVPGGSGPRYFTFTDVENTGKYQLQTPSTQAPRPMFNRLIRWTVTDPMNRFVTGLEQEHFDVRDHGFSKSLVYFEGPDSPTAIAVCSPSVLTDLVNLPAPGLLQTDNIGDAIRHVSSQSAMRKVVLNAGCFVPTQSATIPGGIFALKVEPAMASKWVIEVMNQYVGGFVSDVGPGGAEVSIARQPNGLPPLNVVGFTE